MRIATWNVNSLKARQEAVENWLTRAAPDILLIQETKLGDADAPVMAFAMAGYQLVHHGEGRWNGVAIAVRDGLVIGEVVTNFGDGPVRDSGPGGTAGNEDDFNPFDEARMVAATVDGLRVVSVYAPNGRVVGSPFYLGKLAWFERLGRWLDDEVAAGRGGSLVVGGDYNVAPAEIDVWDAQAVHGGTHVSEAERAAV
ncbi:MAG: exodeoxyribonuclease III, partial [Candidatus Limnocylindrales bacterium]